MAKTLPNSEELQEELVNQLLYDQKKYNVSVMGIFYGRVSEAQREIAEIIVSRLLKLKGLSFIEFIQAAPFNLGYTVSAKEIYDFVNFETITINR